MAYQFPQPYTGAYIKGLFDKLVTQFNLTGMIKISSGVATSAVAGTDYALPHTTATASLTTTWTGSASPYTQTVSVSGVTASNTVIVAPAPASADSYAECQIKCTAQASGELTFTCETQNTSALTVNVVIL